MFSGYAPSRRRSGPEDKAEARTPEEMEEEPKEDEGYYSMDLDESYRHEDRSDVVVTESIQITHSTRNAQATAYVRSEERGVKRRRLEEEEKEGSQTTLSVPKLLARLEENQTALASAFDRAHTAELKVCIKLTCALHSLRFVLVLGRAENSNLP